MTEKIARQVVLAARPHGRPKPSAFRLLVGFVANTCIESTARFGMELGYHVTLIKDATAAFEFRACYSDHRGAVGSAAVKTANK